MARSQPPDPAQDRPKEPLPYDTGAECAVLGSILHNNFALHEVRARLKAEMFFHVGNRWIFTAMLALAAEPTPIDEVTLGAWLKDHGKLGYVAGEVPSEQGWRSERGITYVASLVDATPVTVNVLVYAEIVARCYADRRRVELAEKLRESRGDQKIAREVQGELADLAQFQMVLGSETAEQGVMSVLQRWEAVDKGGLQPILTYTALDKWLFGLEPGFASFIGARPGGGKTTFLLQVALEHIRRNSPVLFVSMEMQHWQLITRMACNIAAVDGLKAIKNPGSMTADEWDDIGRAMKELADLPLFMVGDGKRMTLDQIEYQARRHHDAHGVRIIAVDHMRKVKIEGRMDVYQAQSARAEGLSEIASYTENAAMLVAAQVNRKGADDPKLGDLEGSGVIEQEADAVILLTPHRAGKDTYGHPTEAFVDADIAKSRNGKTGPRKMAWEPQFYRMGAELQDRLV